MPDTLWQLVDASARQNADRPAFVFDEETITYAQLRTRVLCMAKALIAAGVHKGERVGIWLPNEPAWPVCELASSIVGAVVVPINLRLRSRELAHALRHADVSTLVMRERFLTNPLWQRLKEAVPDLARPGADGHVYDAGVPALRRVLVSGGLPAGGAAGVMTLGDALARGERVPDAVVKALAAETSVDDLLFMFWTSGTTSAPKGVLHSHRAVGNVAQFGRHIRLGPQDTVVANKPWFYIAGNFWTMLMPLIWGAKVIVCQSFRAQEVVDAVERHSATTAMVTPVALADYLQLLEAQDHPRRRLRVMVIGGAAPGIRMIERLRRRWDVEWLCQVYGMTESQGYSLATPAGAPDAVVAETVGWPLPGFECRVVAADGADCTENEPGELWVRGRTLVGYHKKPHAESFRQGDWFATGDQVLRTASGFKIVGRLKDVIKVGGENVAAEEVEEVLLMHPEIVRAAVVGVPDARRGEVCAAFVQWRGGALELGQLQAWCRGQMAPFKVPQHLRHVEDGGWPLTESQKIKKRALRDRLLQEPGFQGVGAEE